MKIRVLGSAAGGGLPQWNCGCHNCSEARAGRLPSRLSACVAVSADDEHWVVVNAGSDINRQLAETKALHPTSARANPIRALLLTDANIDHTAGLLEFRQADYFLTYSTDLVKKTLCEGPMFSQFAHGNKRWLTFPAKDKVRVEVEAGDLRIWASPVDGMLPSYAGGQQRAGAAVAYVFEHRAARFVYAPIFLTLGKDLAAELEDADATLLDGTCWSDDEMIELRLGTRTARAMGHAPISGPGGSLEALAALRAPHRYYTHVNNSNPLVDPASPQSAVVRQAGIAVAHDGLEIEI